MPRWHRLLAPFCGVGGGVAVSLTMILTDVSFVQSGDVALIDSGCSCLLVWVVHVFRWRV